MHAKKSRVLAAQIMGATKAQIFRWILFWESLPQTFIGLRSAVSLSLVIIVVTEMFIGTTSGLGRKIIDSQITYEIPTMYATILLAGIVGYLLNLFFLTIEKRFLHWSGK
jgi:NitT/TauT family transport system permease protein